MSRKLHANRQAGRATSSALASFAPAMAASFRGILRDAKALVTANDPLEAEIFVSSIMGISQGVSVIDGDLEQLLGEALTNYALDHANREALTVLLALASVAPGRAARLAARGASDLLANGIRPPVWGSEIAPTHCTAAWQGTEPYGDQDVLMVEFDRPVHGRHGLQLLIDNNLSGMIKDAFVAPSSQVLIDRWREILPELSFQSISAAAAAGIIAAGLAANDSYVNDSPASYDFRATRALVAARLRDLPRPQLKRAATGMRPAARQKLVESFLTSPEAHGERDDGFLAETMVDFRVDYADGDPLRWSPIVVELYMCDWFPRKVTAGDKEIDWLPSVLRGWVRFAGQRRGLPRELIEETTAAVDHFQAEFRQVARDPARFGPAKAIAMAMKADGVDITDAAEAQAWVDAFNAGKRKLLSGN